MVAESTASNNTLEALRISRPKEESTTEAEAKCSAPNDHSGHRNWRYNRL